VFPGSGGGPQKEGGMMEIHRHGSSEVERKHFNDVREMMEDVRKVSREKGIKKIVLHFPKALIPKGRRRQK